MAAKLDAFALNIAYGDNTVSTSVSNAFTAANAKGFKLFFSFDYAGGTGPWPQGDVLNYLTNYVHNGAYYHTAGGQPFISTFEGPSNAADWHTIKAQTNAFFMPDYSSLGSGPAMDTGPYGAQEMNTFVDASYYQTLSKFNVLGEPGPVGKPYMMASGDTLWYDRWQEELFLQPDYVEILTWNDWGESYYIGPQDQTQWAGVFGPDKGNAPITFDNFTHTQDAMTNGTSTTSTTSRTDLIPTIGLQIEFPPASIVLNAVYFWALLAEDAEFSVSLGGKTMEVPYLIKPEPLAAGFYFGTALGHRARPVGYGPHQRDLPARHNELEHVDELRHQVPLKHPDVYHRLHCLGRRLVQAMPSRIENVDFAGLCAFACGKGSCPPQHCTSVSKPVPTPTISPFNPNSCAGGTGAGTDSGLAGLCSWTCGYGYCPIAACKCSATGVLTQPPPTIAATVTAKFLPTPGVMAYDDLCRFACARGHCPTVCSSNVGCVSGTGQGGYEGLCDFSCGRGFCPSPCTCSAFGSAPPPAGYLPNVVGYGLPSLADDFDPLCNFTCNHGYCPTGVCGQEIFVTTTAESGAFATITGLEAESATPTYAPGAMFEYDVPDDESLSLEVMILNTNAKADIASFTCTDASPVSGTDGQSLGCEAEITTPDEWTDTSNKRRRRGFRGKEGGMARGSARAERGVMTRASSSSSNSNHSFQYHAEWQPQPGGNCSTSQCMLLANAPEGVWVPAGNGTSSSGVYHELHFVRTGNVHGHYKLIRPSGNVRYYRDNAANNYGNGFFVQKADRYGRYNFVGASVEKVVARSESSQMCMGFMGIADERDLRYFILGPDATDDQAPTLETPLISCKLSLSMCRVHVVRRRKRSVSEYLELLPLKMLEDLDLDLEDDSNAAKAHVYSLLEKRGPSRNQVVCKNPPGKVRKSVTAKFSSSPYRNVLKLVNDYGVPILGLDGRACAAGISTF
ncbi:glycosyl hydrolase family 71-domain-containing protein [Diplogelasinospora grovesii]|uniref:Glycosyl hydrolase family 71-domain-containing protein n=1 Tax=Diplogelasinospora grovesii TaxID=303347 RepID=A0AAN6MZT8_9PEZI|nr:glycosyl hydrolase family 71-domain-containing protein [Diplogelasinospora grovesii]